VAVDAREHVTTVVCLGDRQNAARQAHDGVVVHIGILVAMAEQLDRRADEQHAEDQEHERERRDQRGA
jgi:hypothetical protein